MSRSKIKIRIAELAYNIIFSAKLNFSTFDVLDKFPGLSGIITAFSGIYLLAYEPSHTKFISLMLTFSGLFVWRLNLLEQDKQNYSKTGSEFTKMFFELRTLYDRVDEASEKGLESFDEKLIEINNKFQEQSISKQIPFLSNWLAHYKLFCEAHAQSDWLTEVLSLKGWRDKVPGSMKAFLIAILTLVFIYVVVKAGLLNKIFLYVAG